MRIAIVRHGDETTTRGKVIALTANIHDDGRKIALQGDQATCGTCKGLWNIIGTGKGVGELERHAVINGDRIVCPCGKNRVIAGADAGMFMQLETRSGGGMPRSEYTASSANPFDEQFTLRDANGRALADAFYTIRFPSGELTNGVTDQAGRTARYATDGAQRLAVYLGHREA